MKCVKNGEVIKRVSDEQAAKLVKQGWNYTNKQEWKKGGRK